MGWVGWFVQNNQPTTDKEQNRQIEETIKCAKRNVKEPQKCWEFAQKCFKIIQLPGNTLMYSPRIQSRMEAFANSAVDDAGKSFRDQSAANELL